MMKYYKESVEINHNSNWPDIPDHPYRILIIGGSESGKTKVCNLIKVNDLLMEENKQALKI